MADDVKCLFQVYLHFHIFSKNDLNPLPILNPLIVELSEFFMVLDMGTDTPVHCLEKTAGSTHSSTSGLSLLEQLERQAEFHSSTQDEA